eukprot:CAMPEP_0205909700 /NCGR_PEP_ID=MMETSP1325-20131115/4044_1 /ASSEMBLY_ACC=CAM_ASM_000708 /TAXON_ID=236786 /ORGANISM="Florenciella sp., Strain RCC1007" /LENGTH=124 /DNA_ID=CAMNT_0053276019 /DNA_START=154 /DNA_END=524 /DNA_ORIENTATION=-
MDGYPNVLPPPPSGFSAAITAFVERQQYNYVHDPISAHADTAAVAVVAGTALGAVRGATSALLSPPAGRLQVFLHTTKAASVIYVIPFLLGSQFDVWCACWDRRNADKRKTSRWGLAGDLGGAA